jgi:hypothetical protein
MKRPVRCRKNEKPGACHQSGKRWMFVVTGGGVQSPRVRFDHIRMQIDRCIGYDLKAGPDEHEGETEDRDRVAARLAIEPPVEHRPKGALQQSRQAQAESRGSRRPSWLLRMHSVSSFEPVSRMRLIRPSLSRCGRMAIRGSASNRHKAAKLLYTTPNAP